MIDFLKLLKVRYLGNVPYQNIFLVGLFLGFLGYLELERNWVPMHIFILIIVLSSCLITLCFWRYYQKELNLVWAFFHNLSWGFLVVFLFMQSNNILSYQTEVTNRYHIEDIELVSRKRNRRSVLKPKITIEVNGKDREFTVSDHKFKQIVDRREVYVTIKKGFWGYDIVKSLKFDE